MQFLERGDDFMIITASNDGHVAVHCLKENILLHKFKFTAKIFQVAVKDDKIVARAAGYKLYELELMKRNEVEENETIVQANRENEKKVQAYVSEQMSSNLADNVKSHFLKTKNIAKLKE